jgi:hypothetical protein
MNNHAAHLTHHEANQAEATSFVTCYFKVPTKNTEYRRSFAPQKTCEVTDLESLAMIRTDDVDEWKTVTKNDKRRVAKQSRKRHPTPSTNHAPIPSNAQQSNGKGSSSPSQEELQNLLNECKEALQRSTCTFFQNCRSTLFLDLSSLPSSISSIVCYGIGTFGGVRHASASMWQLACAMAILDSLNEAKKSDKEDATGGTTSNIDMVFFDPCMTSYEAAFLESNSIGVISSNERGKRLVNDTTLFFMPHCPMSLYTNVLHTNWDHLFHGRVIIFGNSLSAYANRLEMNANVKLLQQLQPHWTESSITMSKEDIAAMPGYFEQAFNDTSITYFVTSEDKESWPDRPIERPGDDDDGGETI